MVDLVLDKSFILQAYIVYKHGGGSRVTQITYTSYAHDVQTSGGSRIRQITYTSSMHDVQSQLWI